MVELQNSKTTLFRRLLSLELIDEDIPTPTPPAAKEVPNDIRIGPITRAHAKLLEQQVNLFLVEPDVFINENFILPKSLHICILRFMGEEGIARGGDELQYEEQGVMNHGACAREEREAGARSIEKHHHEEKAEVSAAAQKL